MRLLIDTDPGVDDALALFLAFGSPLATVQGVSVCFGNAGLDIVGRNAAFICDVAGGRDLPVALGASAPIAQEAISAVVHGEGALGGVRIPANYNSARHTLTSIELYERFLSPERSERGTLVALGPLTNVAAALTKSRDVFNNCERIVILGGTLAGPGNKGPVAEFNFRCDPEAADYVLANCPCPIDIIPLDLCMRDVVSMSQLSSVRDVGFREFLVDLCQGYAQANEREEGIGGIIMYDPLALYCALEPERFSYEKFWMRVDTGNSFARGMSVVDRRLRPDKAPNVRIATDVKWNAFIADFFQALNRVPFQRAA